MEAFLVVTLLATFVCILVRVPLSTAAVYSVEASIDPQTTILSIDSTLEDSCKCRMRQEEEFQCADGDMLTLPCGTYDVFLSCRPLQHDTVEAILSFMISVDCPDRPSVEEPQSQLRCSLTVRNSDATLKCSGGKNSEMVCSLDSGPFNNYSQSFLPEGFMLNDLSCGQHMLTCNSSSLSSQTLNLNFTVSHTAMALPQPIQASIVPGHCSATLALSPSTLVNCTCILDSGASFQCGDGTLVGQELSVGQHVVSLACCTSPDRCGNRHCVEEDIEFLQCPCQLFSANVTTTGSDISLRFSPLPSANYWCLLYNVSGYLVYDVHYCMNNQRFPRLIQGRYHLVVVCQFSSAPDCDQNATISNISVVTPEPAIEYITIKINSSLHVEFKANCKAEFYLCRLNTSNDHVDCASPYKVDLKSLIPSGVYAFEVIAVCTGGVETKPSQLVFKYESDNQTVEANCNATLRLLVSGSRMHVLYAEDPGTTIRCRVDQKSFVSCVNGTVFEGLAVGNHSFDADVNCSDQNILKLNSSFAVAPRPCLGQTVDHVSIAGPVKGILSFLFDAGDSLDTTCSFDGSQPVPCSSPFRVDVSNVCSGKYTFALVGLCNDEIVVNSRGSVTLNRKSEPPSCRGLDFNCSAARMRDRRQLAITCTVTIGLVTSCSVDIPGRERKSLHPISASIHRRLFKNMSSVRSFSVECRNGFDSLSKTVTV